MGSKMIEDTEHLSKPPEKKSNPVESHIAGVSVRGWIVVMVMATLCVRELSIVVISVMNKVPIEQIKEPFYGVVLALIGFYFGQKTQNQNAK